jgi:hypothetical protein
MSNSDILVTGATTCFGLLDENWFGNGAGRKAIDLFDGWLFAGFVVFRARSVVFELAVPIDRFASATWTSSGPATSTSGDLSANCVVGGEGTMVGKLVSMMTRSGSFSTELILITGLSMSAPMGSDAACGRNQFNPSSNSNSALPTKLKYFIKGIGRLLFRRLLGPYRWRRTNERLQWETWLPADHTEQDHFTTVRAFDAALYISILSIGYFARSSAAISLALFSSENCVLKCPSTTIAYPTAGAMSARWILRGCGCCST